MNEIILEAIFYHFLIGLGAAVITWALFAFLINKLKKDDGDLKKMPGIVVLVLTLYWSFDLIHTCDNHLGIPLDDTRVNLVWAFIIPWGASVLYFGIKLLRKRKAEGYYD